MKMGLEGSSSLLGDPELCPIQNRGLMGAAVAQVS